MEVFADTVVGVGCHVRSRFGEGQYMVCGVWGKMSDDGNVVGGCYRSWRGRVLRMRRWLGF